MVMRTVIVGSNHTSTADYHIKLALPPSVLITQTDQSYQIGHTSIQDICDYTDLELILQSADQVYWAECDKSEFVDEDSYLDFLYWLQDYNLRFGNVKNLSDITFDPYGWKMNLPKLNPKDIVFLGGSTTAGVALSDPNTWFSNLIAEHYQRPAVNLAKQFQTLDTVGNNDKTFDIFLQLAFNPEQIVVVQLAPMDRIRWCNDDAELQDLQFTNTEIPNRRCVITVFNRKYLLYRLLGQIQAMIQLARLQKIKLVFWIDNYKLDKEFEQEQLLFYEFPEVVSKTQLADYYVDHAEDGEHAGIESNQFLAKKIIQHIERLYS
jgi:hypothetical protein